jgi:HSP20 family protein
MTLIPFTRRFELATLDRDTDEMFDSLLYDWPVRVIERQFLPSIDIRENENEIMVRAEVPGCKAEDIDIAVNGNILTISGEKKQQEERKEQGCYCSERVYGSFRREITLPSEVRSDKIEAVSKDGVLSITLPKAEKAKSVKVKVKEE